jgi:hypothetical protein
MIEISISEIVLFAWASIATGLYLKTKQEETMVRKLFMHMIENDEAREEMVKQFKLAQDRGDV